MKTSVLALAPLVLTALASVHCDGDVAPVPLAPADAGADSAITQPDAAAGPDAGGELADPPLVPASKVDLLFVIDNSSGMGVKHELLAKGVSEILKGLAVQDIHVGVISTSLGTGGDVCDPKNPRSDDKARLLNRGPGGSVVVGAEGGYLALGSAGVPDISSLEVKTQELIKGVGQTGCGLEVQLEAMYRFVADPEPPVSVVSDDFKTAALRDVDYELLKQRKAFFRPDSAVAIVMVTDEDDGSIDPLSVGGFGYAFASRDFPGSKVRRGSAAQGTTAPRGTSTCATDPLSPDCTSCGFAQNCDPSTAACQKIKDDPNCKVSGDQTQTGVGYDGFYPAAYDELNVRMFDMRTRFGVEPRFPVTRYSTGLTGRLVPSRATAHPETKSASGQRQIAAYAQARTCQNPLFARNLPEKPGDELCQLQDNGRSSRLVFFGLLGGAPADLVSPSANFTKLVGANPPSDGSVSNDDALDPRMVQSTDARPGTSGDYDTQKRDLQHACTFELPTPIDCVGNVMCECNPTDLQPPSLCSGTTQIRGKAYPTFREILLAQQLGDRAIVGSTCDVDAAKSYGQFLGTFASKVNGALAK